MADLRDSEDDRREEFEFENIGDLGAVALIGRCIKIMWTNGGCFRWVFVYFSFWLLLGFMVPGNSTLIELGTVIKPEVQRWANGNFTKFEVEPTKIKDIIFSGLFNDLLRSGALVIPYSLAVYAMTRFLLNQSDKTDILVNAISEVHRKRKRYGEKTSGRQAAIFLTYFCCFALYVGVIVIGGVIMCVACLLSSVILLAAVGLVEGVVVTGLWFAFQMALVVAALEDVKAWGFKPMRRSWILLQGKKWVAFKIFGLKLLLVYLNIFALKFLSRWIIRAMDPAGNWKAELPDYLELVVGTIRIVGGAALGSAILMFIVGTETFLYFSCKALHKESLLDLEIFQNKATQGAYKRLPDHEQSEASEV